METKDSNGAILEDGDSVQVIKDLKVKGANLTLKRGKTFKRIQLTNNDDEVECRDAGTTIVLKTIYLKKVK